jgi:peroxidase
MYHMQSGGPGWSVLLGRLDGFTSSKADAENLPGPFDGLDVLRAKFRNATLDDTTDLVALSGNQTRPHIHLQRPNGGYILALTLLIKCL